MIGLIQWFVTLGLQWDLKRKFSLAIWCKHCSHLNLTQFTTQILKHLEHKLQKKGRKGNKGNKGLNLKYIACKKNTPRDVNSRKFKLGENVNVCHKGQRYWSVKCKHNSSYFTIKTSLTQTQRQAQEKETF